jgi:UDP:flavonoid glycosyltransferase YjiC (YdhE family)
MYGHVNPMLSLALAAQRAEHDVVVATGPDLATHAENHGLAVWPVGPTHEQAGGVTNRMVVALGHDIDWLTYFEETANLRCGDLLPRVAQWRPDLVLSEVFEFAGRIIAGRVDARLAVHGLMKAPPQDVWAPYVDLLGRLVDRWHPSRSAEELLDAVHLEPCPPTLRSGRTWPRAIAVRPSLPRPVSGERSPEWLDALPHAETVLLTLGTVYHGNQAVLQAALRDLRDLPVNVVVTAGPGAEPASFGPQPGNVRIESYLPYLDLMPRFRLVVSQGSIGVTLAGLVHAVPQLCLPQGADQLDYSSGIEDAGAALVLTPERIVPGAIAEAATRMLREPSFASASKVIQSEIAAMPDTDAVVAVLTGAAQRTA